MAGIWVYSEDISIAQQLLSLASTLAGQTGKNVCAITLAGEEAADLIQTGANLVYRITGANPWPESYAAAIADLVKKEKPDLLLIGGTLRGKDVAAKVAAAVQSGLVTDAFAVRYGSEGFETERLMYGGLAVCTEVLGEACLVTVPPRIFDPLAADTGRSGETINVEASGEERLSVGGVCPIVRQGADISTADKIVCVGRGLAKQEDMKLIEELAAALGAEIGCSRSVAEDYHWLPVERYIGLSGQKIKPSIYLSVGVSGQVQHIAGVRDSKLIVAVDMNENAPIFEAADYGIVGDLYQVVPLLISALSARK
jgi:electron transfer flavoprotein alpha subunit